MTCTNCGKPLKKGGTKELCPKCYQRNRRGADMKAPERTPAGKGTTVAFRASQDQAQSWRKAAKRARQAFAQWLRATLDKEAGE